MSGSKSKAETSNMVTNAELEKKMQEQEKINKWLLDEFEKMKGQMEKKSKVSLEKEEEGEEEDTPKQEVVNLPADQRYFIEALERVGKKDAKGDLPIFLGKMDVDVVVDWIKALNNHFECENIVEKDKVKIAQSKLKGPALTWWNFTQRERVKEGKNMITTWEIMCAKNILT